jgi:transcriptional regulator with XRE-family HTH domain
MHIIHELGKLIREARARLGLTQRELALRAGLSQNTLNRLESGLYPDLGIRKVETLLACLGHTIVFMKDAAKLRMPDYPAMASASASTSFTESLAPEELVQALLSGKAPGNRHAHLIALFEESPDALFKGLVGQVGAWAKPGKVEKNLQKLAKQVGLIGEEEVWKRAA